MTSTNSPSDRASEKHASIEPVTAEGRPEATPRGSDAAKLQVWFGRHWRKPVALLLLVVALLMVWQAHRLHEARTALRSITASVDTALPMVERSLAGRLEMVSLALEDGEFSTVVVQDSAAARARAAQRLRKLIPEARDVEVYSAMPDVLLQNGQSGLGYERAAQLARAQGGNKRQVSGFRQQDGHLRLSIVQPIERAGRTVAIVALTLPFSSISRTLTTDVHPSSGRIDVRSGPGKSAPSLASQGRSKRNAVDVARPISDSSLWMTGTRIIPGVWFPDNVLPILPWMLALLALLGALALLFAAHLSELPERVRARREGGVTAQPTFAQVLDTSKRKEGRTEEPGPDPEAAIAVDPSIFRAYDIRGVVGKTLNADVAQALGKAIGSEALERGQKEIAVGRDGRKSGPELVEALVEGLRSTGIDVVDVGQVPTPLVYFACHHLGTGSGVAVTGSHNPPDYNGFKIVLGGETLSGDAIQQLAQRIATGRFRNGDGQLREVDISRDYLDRVADDVQLQQPLRVVVDCGNGVTGDVGPEVLEEIGCEVIPLYDEVDGSFPNHHPDPSDPANLEDLIAMVQHQNADLGVAFDGDGDRLGVVTKEGKIIYPDRLLMLFAMDTLVREPGATIIYDVKCTGHLQSLILRSGGSPLMWQTGHSLIKAKMKETGAALAGEMSGHFFFKERWYGFDDGIYAAARLLEILAADVEERTPEAIFATLPEGVSTPELKIATEEGENHAFIEAFRKKAKFGDARLTTIDGVRVDWSDGWGLVRASNTTPTLVLRFEADDEAALERIKSVFREQLLAVDPDLDVSF